MQRNHTKGFTLIEAVLALAIVSLLLGTAVPAWTNASEAAHSGSAQAALLESMLKATSHATLTGSDVVLCPGTAGGCRASTDWSQGWMSFADLDSDRVRDAHEPLLATAAPLEGRVHLRSTRGRTRLAFQPSGANAGSNVTFTLCDGRGPGRARTLVLANDGRLRAGRPTAAAARACVQSM